MRGLAPPRWSGSQGLLAAGRLPAASAAALGRPHLAGASAQRPSNLHRSIFPLPHTHPLLVQVPKFHDLVVKCLIKLTKSLQGGMEARPRTQHEHGLSGRGAATAPRTALHI